MITRSGLIGDSFSSLQFVLRPEITKLWSLRTSFVMHINFRCAPLFPMWWSIVVPVSREQVRFIVLVNMYCWAQLGGRHWVCAWLTPTRTTALTPSRWWCRDCNDLEVIACAISFCLEQTARPCVSLPCAATAVYTVGTSAPLTVTPVLLLCQQSENLGLWDFMEIKHYMNTTWLFPMLIELWVLGHRSVAFLEKSE